MKLGKNSAISNIELPENLDYVNQKSIVTGFGWEHIQIYKDKKGKFHEEGLTTNILQYASTTVISKKECKALVHV